MTFDSHPEDCARLLRAIADPERLRIIQCLREGPRNVSEVSGLLKDEIVKVSHHLGRLREAGLVKAKKTGRFVVYQLHPEVFQPAANGADCDFLDLGYCRIEIPAREPGPDGKNAPRAKSIHRAAMA
ncbi:MAG: ArsR/SmtB family transcription factor [Planctomycetia bacterium]